MRGMMVKRIFLSVTIVVVAANLYLWQQDSWSQGLKKISEMVSIIESQYYQKVEKEDMVFSSIKGMLPVLDPHSHFLDPSDLPTMQEEYKGKYHGLGIMIQKHGENLMVISPIEGTPAYRLGIRPGDIITHIEGESTRSISSTEAMKKLRGPEGSQVTITIQREGMDPFDLNISREEIPLHSVPYAFILQDDIGYIFIRNFSQTTTSEFKDKMDQLRKQGMKKLILDFRGNGGGTFIQSLEIADVFLEEGAKIVSIKGRRDYYSKEFFAHRESDYEQLPLVILINRGSASAPEIVSGAVQDNDRGLIVGDTSWGKGLVQTVFPLAENAALALTTARYYTPSGRSIQRDYTHLEDYYLAREVPEDEREVSYTVSGRQVMGQGGISPDVVIELTYQHITARMLARGLFFAYAREFADKETGLSQKYLFPEPESQETAGIIPLTPEIQITEDFLKDYKVFLEKEEFEFEEENFQQAAEEIKRELRREVVGAVYGVDAGTRAACQVDPVVIKAIDAFPKAIALIQSQGRL
jgi:carboxyl-terminal processing protease